MRLKLVVPKDKDEWNNSIIYDFVSDDPSQVKLLITYDEFIWLLDHHVWNKINEIADAMVEYGEDEYVSNLDAIKKFREWLIELNKDKEKETLLNNLINLCNEAIQRQSGIVFIL